MRPVIEKIDRQLLIDELTPDKLLRTTNKGGNEVYITDARESPNVMREIGRLREMTFRDAGGGTGLECDIDEFDTMECPCRQMIVWAPDVKEIIGGYRFILGEDVRIVDGRPKIACGHLFEFSPRFKEELLPHTIELGRSFVVTNYQNTKLTRPKAIYALDNLWDGLAAIVTLYPQVKYLFGKVTMYPSFGATGRDMVLGYMQRYFSDPDKLVWPIRPIESEASSPKVQNLFTGDPREDMHTLVRSLKELDRKVPPLVNAYMSLSPTMRVFGTAINDEFGDVEETGIFLKLSEIYEEKKQRHFQTFDPSQSNYAKALKSR